jgi:hypothetical protein
MIPVFFKREFTKYKHKNKNKMENNENNEGTQDNVLGAQNQSVIVNGTGHTIKVFNRVNDKHAMELIEILRKQEENQSLIAGTVIDLIKEGIEKFAKIEESKIKTKKSPKVKTKKRK